MFTKIINIINIIVHVAGAVVSCYLLSEYIRIADLNSPYKFLLFLVIWITAFAYSLTVIFKKFDHTIALICLVALYFGFFAGIDVLKSKQTSINIPDLPKGTIGFRAVNCDVIFTNIKIHYMDKNSNWAEIPKNDIEQKNNWVLGVWPDNQSKAIFIIKEKMTPLIDIDNGLRLRNCGAVFQYANNNLRLQAKNLRLDADVYFMSEDDDKLASCQFCLRVPEHKRKDIRDLYLGFELFFDHPEWTKVWMPALDTQARSLRQAPSQLLMKYGGFNRIRNKSKYKLTAITFDKFAKFIGSREIDKMSVTLCESQF